MSRTGSGSVAVVLVGMLCSACAMRMPFSGGDAHLTHGVAAGEVTETSAVVWARCDGAATLHASLQPVEGGPAQTKRIAVDGTRDCTGRLAFDQLAPGTTYAYRAWCGAEDQKPAGAADARGVFHTPPDPSGAHPVRFAWGGDVGGQNACRDQVLGYPIFDRLRSEKMDFFLGLGDMVYADDDCQPTGRYKNAQVPGPPPAVDVPGYWAHWKYNRDDEALRRFMAETPYYGVWDDHEIANDAGPHDDIAARAPGVHLLPLARTAFLDYQPLVLPYDDPTRLYRRVRWGKHLELFLLDTRSYRDANSQVDDAAHPKTMLGDAQRAWLLDALVTSDATWKIIVSSVPLSIPTGNPNGRDGWANFEQNTGFEHEALAIVSFLHDRKLRDVVWLTTDVHFATGFRYRPFPADPSFTMLEFTSGPLNAGVIMQLYMDSTLNPERLFAYGPESIANFDEAQRWFNYGVVEVDTSGRLVLRIVNGLGKTVYRHAVDPQR